MNSKSVNKGFIKVVREGSLPTGKITPEVIADQLNEVCQRIGSYTFNLKIFVAKEEEERLKTESLKTKRKTFSKLISREEITPADLGGFNHTIDVILNPFDAFSILKAGNIEISYRIRNDWVKDRSKEADSKKVIDPQNPIIGISTGLRFSGTTVETSIDREKIIDIPPYDGMSVEEKNKTLKTLAEKHLRAVVIQVSHEYEVFGRYAQNQIGNANDFVKLRIGLWHEIIETALIFIVTEAFCFPLSTYLDICKNLDSQGTKSTFAHLGMEPFQKNLASSRSILLHWPGDPPFNLEEVRARSYESDAETSEHWAKSNEGLIWGEAANKWSQAQDGWNRASDAWRQVAEHPGREEKINEARLKSEEARKRKLEAERKARPWWEIRQTGHGEVGVEYGCWPHNFRAEVRDAANTFVERIDRPNMDGKFSWGAGRKPGLYLIKADIDYVKPNIQKIVLY